MEKTELAGMNMLKLPEDAEDNILFELRFCGNTSSSYWNSRNKSLFLHSKQENYGNS